MFARRSPLSFSGSDAIRPLPGLADNLMVALVRAVVVAAATSRHRDHGTDYPIELGRALMVVSAVFACVVAG